MTHRLLFVLIGSMLLAAGCAVKPPPPAPEAALRTLDAADLAKTLEGHRGQVVLVDFWATWCGPCLELFPHAMELQQRWGDRGLAVITLSLDDPDNRPAVREFLSRGAATAENFISPYGVGPEAFSAFGIDDGALPHVRIYDRQGKLHKTFPSGGKMIDPNEIERTVEKLLE